MKRIAPFIMILILILCFNAYSIDKKQLNGGWLAEGNYKRLKNNDEFFTTSIRIINIGNSSYYYFPGSVLINVYAKKPYIKINHELEFEILKLKQMQDNIFLLEVQDKHDPTSTGQFQITFLDNTCIIIEIKDGNAVFQKNIRFMTLGKDYKYYLIGKVK